MARFTAVTSAVFVSANLLAAPVASKEDNQRLKMEIDNLRALPRGFAAWCDGTTLRIGSRSSNFFISRSALCNIV